MEVIRTDLVGLNEGGLRELVCPSHCVSAQQDADSEEDPPQKRSLLCLDLVLPSLRNYEK